MPANVPFAVKARFEALCAELADLAFALERRGRVDAADVVMQIDRRVRELAEEIPSENAGDIAAAEPLSPVVVAAHLP